MISFNQVTVVGNLTRDVELRAMPDGKYVGSFSVAVNDSYKNKSGVKVETVEFVNCDVFGKSAEIIAQYMRKGSQILVQGKLRTHSWEKDGSKRSQTRVVVNYFKFGSSNAEATTGTSAPPPAAAATPDEVVNYPTEDISPEDIPF